MATLTAEGAELHLALTGREKLAGLHGDVRVPLTAVREVTVEPDALAAVRGLRAPGLALPGRTKIGTWRGRGGKRFVVARRDAPAVRVALDGAAHEELIVSVEDAETVAAEIRARAGLAAAGGA
jgi:hypothetical protein